MGAPVFHPIEVAYDSQEDIEVGESGVGQKLSEFVDRVRDIGACSKRCILEGPL